MERSFHNIIEHNGLGVSLIGFTTVLCTLMVLGFIVSKMPLMVSIQEKIADFIFNRGRKNKNVATSTPASSNSVIKDCEFNIRALDRAYRELAVVLDDAFKLSDLYALAREWDLEHPYLSVTALREAGIIVPAPNRAMEELFIYRPQRY